MVILGGGIGGAILRTFMTGFFLFSKVRAPQKCFSSPDEVLAHFGLAPDGVKKAG